MEPAEALRILEDARASGLAAIARAGTLDELRDAEVAVLGRKAPLSHVQRSLGAVPAESRRDVGRATNEVREALRAALEERERELRADAERRVAEADRID
ncbi:MAG TPA: phenylalanine--tRNA ligase subunit alpha, partial [Actinomycetota bacterium]|nr:phenylalanine--tRNA ligase subunit alpha [Actinomycetota bacterium]